MIRGIALSIDSIDAPLTGIGRYTQELAYRISASDNIGSVRFYKNGFWSNHYSSTTQFKNTVKGKPQKKSPALNFFRKIHGKLVCNTHLFHGTNYFLPLFVSAGIVTIHDLSVFKFPETHPADRVAQFERQFNSSVARALHLITDSEATRLEVINYLGCPVEKITAVPLGVSNTFSPQPVDIIGGCLRRYGLVHGQYALCTSTLEPRKKIERLLAAYQILPQTVRQLYPLILIGSSGWLSEALLADIARLSLQGWLKYLGFVPQDDLPLLYSGARAFVYPSVYEGFGLPVLEAMASGVPVVASPFTSLPEVTQGAALLVDPDDVDALATAIHRSLVDENWRRTATSSGLAVAQTFSWDRCADQTIKVYQSISG